MLPRRLFPVYWYNRRRYIRAGAAIRLWSRTTGRNMRNSIHASTETGILLCTRGQVAILSKNLQNRVTRAGTHRRAGALSRLKVCYVLVYPHKRYRQKRAKVLRYVQGTLFLAHQQGLIIDCRKFRHSVEFSNTCKIILLYSYVTSFIQSPRLLLCGIFLHLRGFHGLIPCPPLSAHHFNLAVISRCYDLTIFLARVLPFN